MTSRSQILMGARRLIDEEGWEKLTVRRLAKDLGIGATTIYHHVRDRDDLLIQLINEHARSYPRPVLPTAPRERVIVATLAMHEALGAMPWAADVLAADGEACLGRPGEDALWFADVILEAATEAGCTQEQAGELFLSLWFFTVGELLVRVGGARRRAKSSPSDETQPDQPIVSPNTRIFTRGVRALVNGTLDHTD